MRDRYRANGLPARRVLLAALLALLPFAAAVPAAPAPTLRLLDRDPPHDPVLRSGEPLHLLRLGYRSATPIPILAGAHHRGQAVRGFRQDAEEPFPARDREATLRLAYLRDAAIDRLRIEAWSPDAAWVAVADFPIAAAWTDANEPRAAAPGTTKSRAAELTPEQRERIAETSIAADEPGGFDPFDLIFLCVPGYFLLQAVLTIRTSGGWRKASLAPAVIMVPVVTFTVLAFAAPSNLWPLLLLLSAPLAFLYLVVLGVILLLRRLVRAA